MKCEVGQLLHFNKKDWGFLSHKGGKLVVFSLEEKKAYVFNVPKSNFEMIAKKSIEDLKLGLSVETVKFASEEKKKSQELLNSLKPGIKFIGNDGETYSFIRKVGTKLVFCQGSKEYTAEVDFVKSVTNEMDENPERFLMPVSTKKEFNALSDKEKVAIAVAYCKSCYSEEGTEFELLEIGNIVSGEAYYHEVDKYYPIIGLQIKYRYKFDFQNKSEESIGLFPIFIGKVANYYPISFEEGYGGNGEDFSQYKFDNGCGDSFEVYDIITKKETLKDAYPINK